MATNDEKREEENKLLVVMSPPPLARLNCIIPSFELALVPPCLPTSGTMERLSKITLRITSDPTDDSFGSNSSALGPLPQSFTQDIQSIPYRLLHHLPTLAYGH